MKKLKRYPDVLFDAALLRAAADKLSAHLSEEQVAQLDRRLEVDLGSERWVHDEVNAFLADCEGAPVGYLFELRTGTLGLGVNGDGGGSEVWVQAPAREDIEAIFSLFEAAARA